MRLLSFLPCCFILSLRAEPLEIQTISGTGAGGYTGDGGSATAAQLQNPYELCLRRLGLDQALYSCDMNNQVIHRIKDGKITTLAGTGKR